MAQLPSALKSAAPELTPDQLTNLSGGYEHSKTSDVPGGIDAAVAADVLASKPDVARRFFRLLASGAGAAALAVLLAACGPNGDPTEHPTTSASDTPTPAPTETEAPATPSPFTGELATSPDQIAEYRTMPLDEFKALPPSERTAFFLSLAMDPQNGLASYAELYDYVTDLSNDKLPTTISVDNSPEELIMIGAYGIRFAMSFDPETAQKVLAGTMYDLDAKNYTDVVNSVDTYAPISARVLGALDDDGGGVSSGTLVSAGEKVINSDGTAYIDVVVQAQGAQGPYKLSGRYYFVKNGSTGTWVIGAGTVVE